VTGSLPQPLTLRRLARAASLLKGKGGGVGKNRSRSETVGAIDGILEAAPPVNMAVIAHGGVGALLLCRLKGVPISRAEDQPGEGGGNFFVFRRDDRALLQGWHPIDVAPTRVV
jgi:broad specificity phosphatase PhoE